MLLTPQQINAIAYGAGGALIAAGVVTGRLMLHRDRRILAATGYAVAVFGLFFALLFHGMRIVVVRLSGTAPTRLEQQLLGTTVYHYVNGRAEEIQAGRGRTIVINDTPWPMVMESVRYGLGPSSEADLPPFQSIAIGGNLEYFGPDDRPPAEIKASTGLETYWLRW